MLSYANNIQNYLFSDFKEKWIAIKKFLVSENEI